MDLNNEILEKKCSSIWNGEHKIINTQKVFITTKYSDVVHVTLDEVKARKIWKFLKENGVEIECITLNSLAISPCGGSDIEILGYTYENDKDKNECLKITHAIQWSHSFDGPSKDMLLGALAEDTMKQMPPEPEVESDVDEGDLDDVFVPTFYQTSMIPDVIKWKGMSLVEEKRNRLKQKWLGFV